MDQNEKINWKKYTDHIYCINFTKSTNDVDWTMNEFKRIGILDSGMFTNFYNITSPLYEVLYKSFTPCGFLNYTNNGDYNYAFDCSIAHYFCIKQAYELGYEYIMVVENDLCFLKNITYIKNILEAIYANHDKYDIIVTNTNTFFFKFLNTNPEFKLNNIKEQLSNNFNITRYTAKPGFILHNAGLNFYNRTGMKTIIDIFESLNYIIIDVYVELLKKCNIGYTFPSLAIQQKEIFQWPWNIINEMYSIKIPTLDEAMYFFAKELDNNTILQGINYRNIVIDNVYTFINDQKLDKNKYEDYKMLDCLYQGRITNNYNLCYKIFENTDNTKFKFISKEAYKKLQLGYEIEMKRKTSDKTKN